MAAPSARLTSSATADRFKSTSESYSTPQHFSTFAFVDDNTNLSNDPFRIGRCFPDNTNASIPQIVFLAPGGGSCGAWLDMCRQFCYGMPDVCYKRVCGEDTGTSRPLHAVESLSLHIAHLRRVSQF